ncbi:YbhN family protein [Jatrophihabitans sp.]|uniref:lysylphosphatidylglycerol synthase transmembrane domain-containing protein n=1 Tax=Jatrophihabitans sp. TaxID=1932789 RepID=UPI0030C6D011|nr:rane protein [Jatrophihabitans sp.]
MTSLCPARDDPAPDDLEPGRSRRDDTDEAFEVLVQEAAEEALEAAVEEAAEIVEALAPARPKPIARRIWRVALIVVLVAMLVVEGFVLGPYLARAGSALTSPDLRWLAVAVLAELVSMGAFARVQRRMLLTGGPRVSVRQMVALTYAANAVSVTLPGGAALSSAYVFRRLRSWGATVPAAGFTVIASGVLSTASFALLAITCAVLAGSGGVSSAIVIVMILAVAAAVVLTRRHHGSDIMLTMASRGLRRANLLMHRPAESGLAALQRFIVELTAIKPRSRDWLAGLGFAGLNWVADLVCLLASCRAVGAGNSTIVLVMVAYIAGMSASSISLLPGGLGVVDAAMIFALTSGGVSTVSATAAVILYRLVSYALIVALGWIVWFSIWFFDRRVA